METYEKDLQQEFKENKESDKKQKQAVKQKNLRNEQKGKWWQFGGRFKKVQNDDDEEEEGQPVDIEN